MQITATTIVIMALLVLGKLSNMIQHEGAVRGYLTIFSLGAQIDDPSETSTSDDHNSNGGNEPEAQGDAERCGVNNMPPQFCTDAHNPDSGHSWGESPSACSIFIEVPPSPTLSANSSEASSKTDSTGSYESLLSDVFGSSMDEKSSGAPEANAAVTHSITQTQKSFKFKKKLDDIFKNPISAGDRKPYASKESNLPLLPHAVPCYK
jgi:hypothetical protein